MSDTAITFELLGPGPTFSKQSIWLPQLILESSRRGHTTIEDLKFDGCLVEGLAVILPIEGCVFEDCNFGDAQGDPRILILRAAGGDRVTGVVGFRNCEFRNCQFVGVGFTGPDYFLDGMIEALGGSRQ